MKALHYILLAIAIIILGFYAFNNYIYTQKQGDNSGKQAYQGTLSGEYVCLPYKDGTDPQTKECALGIKTVSGEYYAINFNLLSQEPPSLTTGDKFKATGTITPIELLSTDHWQKYPIEGIFSVTSSIEKI